MSASDETESFKVYYHNGWLHICWKGGGELGSLSVAELDELAGIRERYTEYENEMSRGVES